MRVVAGSLGHSHYLMGSEQEQSWQAPWQAMQQGDLGCWAAVGALECWLKLGGLGPSLGSQQGLGWTQLGTREWGSLRGQEQAQRGWLQGAGGRPGRGLGREWEPVRLGKVHVSEALRVNGEARVHAQRPHWPANLNAVPKPGTVDRAKHGGPSPDIWTEPTSALCAAHHDALVT